MDTAKIQKKIEKLRQKMCIAKKELAIAKGRIYSLTFNLDSKAPNGYVIQFSDPTVPLDTVIELFKEKMVILPGDPDHFTSFNL